MPNEENPHGFVRAKLPWVAAGGLFLIFLVTLNHWVNLRSLPVTARITGWDWTLPVQHPLLYALTFPLRFFPAALQPLALNAFTALCAALALGFLARSVALLPHDRTHEQRTRERSEFSLLSTNLAWVPPLLAVLVCGLQLTFWEHATALTGEALDLVLFAYVIRCLLEFRVSQNESWLSKFALVYGLAVTNDWAMIGFFPVFLTALIWIKGLRFFDPGFLVRMTVLGCAGLLLYLLLPAVWMLKSTEDYSFWQVLKANWVSQKMFLVDMKVLRNRALLLSLTSLLPVFLMGIRWPSSFGDTSAAGATLTNLAFRVIHLFFLAACVWVAFDPKYSPRHLGMGLTFLSFYYVAALAIGYYSGYALLVFSAAPRKSHKRDDALGRIVNPVVRAAVLLLLAGVPAGLFYKNYASVQASNGAILREFVNRTIKVLPAKPAYLLSEDPYQLALVQAGIESAGGKGDYVMVNTRSLEAPAYHEQMRKRYGARWPEIIDFNDPPARVDPVEIQQMVRGLAATNIVIYLHPSFGYFFEYLHPEPNGQIYELKAFEKEQILPPALSAHALQSNAAFWNEPAEHLQKIQTMARKDSADAIYLSAHYARALNTWGVFLQRAGNLPEAGRLFSQAFEMNTNNLTARLNRDFNKAAQGGETYQQFDVAKADELLGAYRSWDDMLAGNGPVDHPDLCLMLGASFINQSQFRQAALQYSRAVHFQTTNVTARLGFAKALVFGGWPAKGLEEIARIEKEVPNLAGQHLAQAAGVRAAAYYSQTNFAMAEETLKTAQAAYPNDPTLPDSLFELYRVSGRYTNALAVLDQQIRKSPTNLVAQLQKAELLLGREEFARAHETLDIVLATSPNNSAALMFHAFAFIQEKKYEDAMIRIDKVLQSDPENVQALVYKGIIHMEQKNAEKARESFDRALKKQPENLTVLRNRAILNLRSERWDDAKDDYEALRRAAPKSHAVLYGLGEVAYHQKDFEKAKRHYESYLKNAPALGSAELEEEKKKVQARLQEISSGKK